VFGAELGKYENCGNNGGGGGDGGCGTIEKVLKTF